MSKMCGGIEDYKGMSSIEIGITQREVATQNQPSYSPADEGICRFATSKECIDKVLDGDWFFRHCNRDGEGCERKKTLIELERY